MARKLLLLIFLIGLLVPGVCLAQSNPTGGISVTPSIVHIDLSVDPAEYTLTYTNNFNSDVVLKLSAKDFTALEDSYQLEFLNQNQDQNYKYGLSSWISFENPYLDLSPHETSTVKVFIDKQKITRGGHYASILAEVTQPQTTKDIGVQAVISSLLFVRASTGQEIEEGKIFSFDPLRDGIDFPDSFLLRFENSGNVHVIPYGLLQIYDPLGNLVGKGIVNEDSLDALPESIRNYTIKVKSPTSLLLPGEYTAKLYLHFGKTGRKLQTSIKFFSQGSFNLLQIGVGIILIIIAIFIYRKRGVRPKERTKLRDDNLPDARS